MQGQAQENELRISVLSNQDNPKIPLFPILCPLVEHWYCSASQQLKLQRLQQIKHPIEDKNPQKQNTFLINAQKNANIQATLLIMLSYSFTSEHEVKNEKKMFTKLKNNNSNGIINFINLILKTNIQFTSIQNTPEHINRYFEEKTEEVWDKISDGNIDIRKEYGYFKTEVEEDSREVTKLDVTNLIMKKYTTEFLHYLSSKLCDEPQNIIQKLSQFFQNHSELGTMLLVIAVRSILFYEYQLYDCLNYEQQISDHTLYTTICDIFQCSEMKIEANSCCFYNKYCVLTILLRNMFNRIEKNYFVHYSSSERSNRSDGYGNSTLSFKPKLQNSHQSNKSRNDSNLNSNGQTKQPKVNRNKFFNEFKRSYSIEISMNSQSERFQKAQKIEKPSLIQKIENQRQNNQYTSQHILQYLNQYVKTNTFNNE